MMNTATLIKIDEIEARVKNAAKESVSLKDALIKEGVLSDGDDSSAEASDLSWSMESHGKQQNRLVKSLTDIAKEINDIAPDLSESQRKKVLSSYAKTLGDIERFLRDSYEDEAGNLYYFFASPEETNDALQKDVISKLRDELEEMKSPDWKSYATPAAVFAGVMAVTNPVTSFNAIAFAFSHVNAPVIGALWGVSQVALGVGAAAVVSKPVSNYLRHNYKKAAAGVVAAGMAVSFIGGALNSDSDAAADSAVESDKPGNAPTPAIVQGVQGQEGGEEKPLSEAELSRKWDGIFEKPGSKAAGSAAGKPNPNSKIDLNDPNLSF